jgi:predicted glycoside hydrolase/deacetylase ChbG (UPF0249 family)
MEQKFLIINADDLGFSHEINLAVMNCYKAGRVTDMSVMPCGDLFDGACALLKSNGITSCGAHLALTGKLKPLSPLRSYDGFFPSDYKKLIFSGYSGEEIYSELRAQLEKLASSGLKISHVDAHEHVHMMPMVFGPVLRLAREFGVRYVRVPYENISMTAEGFTLKDMARFIALRGMVSGRKKTLLAAGICFNTAFFGHFHSGRMNDGVFSFMLDRVEPGVSEVAVHPAVRSDKFLAEYPWYKNSAKEYELLLKGEWFSKLKANNIQLASYAEL